MVGRVLCILIAVGAVLCDEEPIVQTLQGLVKGTSQLSSRDGTPFLAFYGIPFAKPPLGELRFKDPLPPDPWTGILDTSIEAAPECKTIFSMGSGSENCLYLNVYTTHLPDNSSTEPKAVYIVVHGGAFLSGDASTVEHSPDFYMDKDIIFVSFNYRLGVLGFLSLQDEEVPGNAGLKDQRLAFQWVQDNIAQFGGDPTKVTIGGQSAGGGSTGFHLLSPSTAGMYRAAILQSATAITPWAYKPADECVQSAFHLGSLAGCKEANAEQNKTMLLECLQNKSADALTALEELALRAEELIQLQVFSFIPTIEPDLEGAFLTEDPYVLLEESRFNKVPVIVGSVSNEGLLILPTFRTLDPTHIVTAGLTQDATKFVPNSLNLTMADPRAANISDSIKEFYFSGGTATQEELIYLVTVVQFTLQIQQFAKVLSEKSGQPVYNYFFTYDGPYGENKPFNDLADTFGVMHGDELGYLTNVERVRPAYNNHTDRSSVPELTIDRMTTLWTNFVKTGNPTAETSVAVPIEWEAFKSPDYKYLDIGETLVVDSCILSEHMNFWNDIYQQLGGGRPLPQPS